MTTLCRLAITLAVVLYAVVGHSHGFEHHHIKRLVPSGPNREEPPEVLSSPIVYKRLVLGGPNPITSPPVRRTVPDLITSSDFKYKRLVPKGPTPITSPPAKSFVH